MYQTLIDVAELRQNLQNPNWIIVDCRFRLANTEIGKSFYSEAHIPGALYVHLDDDLSSHAPVTDAGRHPLPSIESMAELFGRLGITAGKQVVIYDDFKHAFASRMWWMLRYMGHEATAVLNGGWQAWLDSGARTSDRKTISSPATFVAEPNAEWLVQIDGAKEANHLIDSRSPERYRGEIEPLDPIAGHIPGAVNYFFAQNLAEGGRFKSQTQLNEQLQPVLGSHKNETPTFYCGSGVTACVNVLATVHAGFAMPRLYIGSWSEWSRTNPDAIGRG